MTVEARFQTLQCGEEGSTLGTAGPVETFRDFPGGQPGTWYPGPMAESIAGTEMSSPGAVDLVINFNSAIDTACLGPGTGWYYGTEGAAAAGQIAFVTVALHELAHGLGFVGLVNLTTGSLFQGAPDIYSRLTYDTVRDQTWDEMSSVQRRNSAVREQEVSFIGNKTRRRGRRLLGGTPLLRIAAPRALAGDHLVGTAVFGPAVDEDAVTAEMVLADDGTADPTLACSPLVNGAAIAGKIAVVDRGECFFVVKVANAQSAGAIAVVVVNNIDGALVTLGGDDDGSITIPSVMIRRDLGRKIKRRL